MRRFIRYSLIQCVAYGLDMGGFILLYTYYEINPLLANVSGKVLAGIFAFIAHRIFTFNTPQSKGIGYQAASYFSLLMLNVPLSALLLSLTLWIISIPIGAKFLTDIGCLFLTYWLSSRFIFLAGESSPKSRSRC